MTRIRKLLCAGAGLLAISAGLRAQGPVVPVSPLAPAPARVSPGNIALLLEAAQRAQDLGMPSIAVDVYREAREIPGVDREALTYSLITALLDAGDATAAEKALAEIAEPHPAAWHVRAGLTAFQLRNRAQAQAEWDVIVADEVPLADKPWYWFLGGALYDTATPRDQNRANQFYNYAEASATTLLSKARFQLAGERVRLAGMTKPTDAEVNAAIQNYNNLQGQPLSYTFAANAVGMLYELNRPKEAVDFLNKVLQAIPAQNRRARDEMRFVLGVLGDRSRGGPGRAALEQLLEHGQNPERQRQALQLLAAAPTKGGVSGGAALREASPERADFLALLTRLVNAKPDHPVKEAILFFRAQVMIADKNFAAAERDAEALLTGFPASPLKVHVLALLAQSAWEQQRYRIAATQADRARAELAAPSTAPSNRVPMFNGRARADLGVLEAEAYFRAVDYRNAADIYAVVLREQRADLDPARIGGLIFQRVLAEIRAGGDAAKVLDEFADDPAFDLENRWQAEWQLARELQTRGPAATRQALARVTTLIDRPVPAGQAVRPQLYGRMAWLQSRLALESGDAEQAVKRVETLLAMPLEIEQPLKDDISSMALLVKARAELALNREAPAFETLKKLRETYGKTEAAISSYLIESEYYSDRENIDEARKTLVTLVNNSAYKNSEYYPDALYRLALLSERLGGEQNLAEAYRRLENLVEHETAENRAPSPVIFRARMEQGGILRNLNDFPAAERIYKFLSDNYAQSPEVVYAQLELAKCHNAWSATDRENRTHADTAMLLFEQLRDRVDAPADVRVEAGYNLGKLLERLGKVNEAVKVWWELVEPLTKGSALALDEGATRRYWLARALFDVGEALIKLQRFDEARPAFTLLVKLGLQYQATAKLRLEQLGVAGAKEMR